MRATGPEQLRNRVLMAISQNCALRHEELSGLETGNLDQPTDCSGFGPRTGSKPGRMWTSDSKAHWCNVPTNSFDSNSFRLLTWINFHPYKRSCNQGETQSRHGISSIFGVVPVSGRHKSPAGVLVDICA